MSKYVSFRIKEGTPDGQNHEILKGLDEFNFGGGGGSGTNGIFTEGSYGGLIPDTQDPFMVMRYLQETPGVVDYSMRFDGIGAMSICAMRASREEAESLYHKNLASYTSQARMMEKDMVGPLEGIAVMQGKEFFTVSEWCWKAGEQWYVMARYRA